MGGGEMKKTVLVTLASWVAYNDEDKIRQAIDMIRGVESVGPTKVSSDQDPARHVAGPVSGEGR